MAHLKVLNVGQGDSIVIRSEYCCKYRNDLIYVDVGTELTDVTKEIKEEDKVHIVLTHHHADHIGGLKYFFNKFNQVEDITIPFNFNEIALISNAILHLKGFENARNCYECTRQLSEVTGNHYFIRSVLNNCGRNIKINFAYDGYNLCDHMQFLNPRIDAKLIKELDEIPESEVGELAHSLFETDFAKKFISYVKAVKGGYETDHQLIELFIYNRRYDEAEDTRERAIMRSKAGCGFVICFLKDNYNLLQAFNSTPNKAGLQKVCDVYKNSAHDVCLVMKADFDGEHSILLTGDASKQVFNRLIKEGRNLRSYYLKVPHHGSKNNLNKTILKAISPRIAVISHNNGLFGRQIDPHPNMPVLNLLSSGGIKIAVTNDVKKGDTIYPHTIKSFSDGYLEVE